jgi:hypothetical protein
LASEPESVTTIWLTDEMAKVEPAPLKVEPARTMLDPLVVMLTVSLAAVKSMVSTCYR